MEESTRSPEPTNQRRGISDDWLAMAIASGFLIFSLVCVLWTSVQNAGNISHPLGGWIGQPQSWSQSIGESLWNGDSSRPIYGCFVSLIFLSVPLAVALKQKGESVSQFLLAFFAVWGLATFAYVLARHEIVQRYNLEYAVWALLIGLLISNLLGTPNWMRPAVQTELYIKTGLVLLGAEVLFPLLLKLGIPGIAVAWVVTPTVLIATFWFGQRVLKMESPSLNMVIAADMSVCGVSAAIAAAAACKAKKEELSLAIGMSLCFTAVMMIVLPIVAKWIGLNEIVAGAWIGGTIDSTGAVAAAGLSISDNAMKVAATVKLIQNVLIGASAFGIATYWVTCVDTQHQGQSRPQVSEIWQRFPRFVLGFLAASIVFSCVHTFLVEGEAIATTATKGFTKTIRAWLFCLAFVSIGLETRFLDFLPMMRKAKPLVLYICGQTLNVVLTLLAAYLMFGILYPSLVIE